MPELLNQLHSAGFSGYEALEIIKELQYMSKIKESVYEAEKFKNAELEVNYVTLDDAHDLPEFKLPKRDDDQIYEDQIEVNRPPLHD